MKQYKQRCVIPAISMAACVLMAVVTSIILHQWYSAILFVGPFTVQVAQYVRFRKMSEQEWKRMWTENDERAWAVRGRAAWVTWLITFGTLCIAIVILGILGDGNDTYTPALWALLTVMMVHVFAFLIAQAVINKRS